MAAEVDPGYLHGSRNGEQIQVRQRTLVNKRTKLPSTAPNAHRFGTRQIPQRSKEPPNAFQGSKWRVISAMTMGYPLPFQRRSNVLTLLPVHSAISDNVTAWQKMQRRVIYSSASCYWLKPTFINYTNCSGVYSCRELSFSPSASAGNS